MRVTAYGTAELLRIDPESNTVTDRVRAGASPCGVVTGAGAVWG
jgi:hypothetical protein